MKQTVFTGILALIMCAVLTVLGLFDFPCKEIVISLVGIVLFAGATYLLKKLSPKSTVKQFLGLRLLRFRDIGAIIGCLLILAFGAFMLNALADGFYGLLGITVTRDPVSLTDGNYALLMITAVLLPAVYEELFFRGALQSFMTEKGTAFHIIWGAFLFTLMHGFDPYFLTTFFAGTVFGLSVKLTGSVYAAITLHFINNILSYAISYYSDLLSEVELTGVMIYFAGLVFLVSIYFILNVAIKKNRKNLKRSGKGSDRGGSSWQERITSENGEINVPEKEEKRKTAER